MTKSSPQKKPARKQEPKTVRLAFDFSGIPAVSLMFVATPDIIENYIRRIPGGETRNILAMQREIARRRRCDAICPVSTAIFVRMVAEHALKDIAAGIPVCEVAPFWLLISSTDKIAKRLPADPAWIDTQRALEGSASFCP
jgi:hypothetical protein